MDARCRRTQQGRRSFSGRKQSQLTRFTAVDSRQQMTIPIPRRCKRNIMYGCIFNPRCNLGNPMRFDLHRDGSAFKFQCGERCTSAPAKAIQHNVAGKSCRLDCVFQHCCRLFRRVFAFVRAHRRKSPNICELLRRIYHKWARAFAIERTSSGSMAVLIFLKSYSLELIF
jgi:hypothetical protein